MRDCFGLGRVAHGLQCSEASELTCTRRFEGWVRVLAYLISLIDWALSVNMQFCESEAVFVIKSLHWIFCMWRLIIGPQLIGGTISTDRPSLVRMWVVTAEQVHERALATHCCIMSCTETCLTRKCASHFILYLQIRRCLWIHSTWLLPEYGGHSRRQRTYSKLTIRVEDESSIEWAVEVLAVTALTVVAAVDASLEAFAVLFKAPWLFTCTALKTNLRKQVSWLGSLRVV